MIRAEDIPDEAWAELALHLESYGIDLSAQRARLAAAAALNAWPGVSEEEYVTWPRGKLMHLILPLPPGKGEA